MKKSGLPAVFALAAAFVLGSGAVYVADHGTLLHQPVNDNARSAPAAAPRIGSIMADRSVYAGPSPDTNNPMYTTPADAPGGPYTWDKGKAYCEALAADGHQDWRAPTKGELNVLFQNRAAIGGFDTAGSDTAGWYWSSTPLNSYSAWAQRFSDGGQYYGFRNVNSSLRCVR